jgi:hypothetical protein
VAFFDLEIARAIGSIVPLELRSRGATRRAASY